MLDIFEIESLKNYLPRLASNCCPPALCLLSSQNYRQESLAPSYIVYLRYFVTRIKKKKKKSRLTHCVTSFVSVCFTLWNEGSMRTSVSL
jgi:hypothetical protein